MPDQGSGPTVSDPHAAVFPLTPSEQARLGAAPFPNNPEHWKWFAASVSETLLESYANGGLDFRGMLTTMRGCALGCSTSERLMILGMLAERALNVTPAETRKRRYPDSLQRLAAGLVELLRQERPEEKFQTVLEESVSWLTTVGICDTADPIDTGTLKNWYLKHKRAAGDAIVRGRPRSRP